MLSRSRHPNAGVRKDTLGGLKEILVHRVGKDVGKVIRVIGVMISDEVCWSLSQRFGLELMILGCFRSKNFTWLFRMVYPSSTHRES